MRTTKTAFGTNTERTTSVAELGSVVRLDLNNFNTSHLGFVFNEPLQLVEAPVTYPIVHYSPSILFPDSFQVFHNYLASIKTGNNVFTDVVVYPSHITSFSSRDFLEQSLTGTSAFDLQSITQMFELPFDLFDFIGIIKPAVRTDGEVVYSEVNAQKGMLRATILLSGVDLFREDELEKTSALFIQSKQTFSDFPLKILFVTGRDVEHKLLPDFQQSKNQSISFEVGTSGEIVSDRSSIDDWLGLCFLDHATGLFDTTNSNLSRQLESCSNSMINNMMQFEVLGDFIFPSIINTELESFSISFDSCNNFFGWLDSNLGSDCCSHETYDYIGLFKPYARMSSDYKRRYGKSSPLQATGYPCQIK
jgi:hypothetical protein